MSDQPQTSFTGCFVRLWWGLAGPALLLILGSVLILDRPPLGSPLDVAFGVVLATALAARYLDRPRANAEAGDIGRSRPHGYALAIGAAAVAIFIVAHFVRGS